MDVVKQLFGTEDLYQVFGIDKENVKDEKALRSAYMIAALKYHPDKAPKEERDTFTKKFVVIQKIYEVFKDDAFRQVYDQTGTWPDNENLNLSAYGLIDHSDISDFQKIYQGSADERQDIKKFYEKGNGDLFYICDNVFFLNILDDEERVNDIIESLIKSGEMKRAAEEPSNEIRKRKLLKAKQEAAEAEKMLKEINSRNRQGGNQSLLAYLAGKAGATKKGQ